MTYTFDSEVSLHYWLLWPTLRRLQQHFCFIGSLTMGSTARAGVLGMILLLKNRKIKNHMEADDMRENMLMPL